MEKMRIVQVGVGGFGKGWINVVKNSPEWEIAGIVDVNRENLESAAKEYGLPEGKCFPTFAEYLKQKIKAEAVLNVTPPRFHSKISIQAMKKGLDVLVEKPLSDRMEDAKKMAEVSRTSGRKLMVSQNYRYKSQPRTLRKIIEEDIIGKIDYVVVNFQKGPKFSGFRIGMEYPLLIDMAIHHFDLMRYITGQNPLQVYAESWNPYWSWFKGHASLSLSLLFSEKVHILYTGSWVSQGKDTTWDGDWEIYGEKGTLIWKDDRILLLSEGEQREIPLLRLEREHQTLSLYEFYKALKEKREPETGVNDNIKSLAVVFKSLESIKKRCPVYF
jgi:predicted dehydrogenase